MIIADEETFKVDLARSKDGWLEITSFRRKGDEWTWKTIHVPPGALGKLMDYVADIQLSEEKI